MPGFLIRVLITAVGLLLASMLVPGVVVASPVGLLFAALVLGFVNALVRPVVVVLTLPLTILTLGLFLLVVNAAMLQLVDWFIDDFAVTGFWAAVLASLIIALTSMIGSWFIGPKGKYEVFVARRDG